MDSSTGSTLFRLLGHPDDGDAWRRFVQRYGPLLSQWCARRGMQADDAEEVTQEVLCRLLDALRTYDATRPFRPWLKGIAAKVWYDVRTKQAKAGHPAGTAELHALPEQQREAEDDFQRLLDRFLDIELVNHASQRAQLRVEPRTWGMFHAVVLEETAVKEVAQRYGLTESGVYRAVYRVNKILEQELRRLEEGALEDKAAAGRTQWRTVRLDNGEGG